MFFKIKSGSLSFAFISAAFVLFSVPAFADAGQDPVGHGLSWFVNDILLGATGIGLCTIAVIGVGLLCLGHYLEWKRLIQTIIGVAIYFGSTGIVAAIIAIVKH